MAPRRKPAQPNPAGDGGPEAAPKPSNARKRGGARKPGPPAAADPETVATTQPVRPAGPSLEQRLHLLEQALGEIGKFCNALVGSIPSPAAPHAGPTASGPDEPAPGSSSSRPQDDVSLAVTLSEFLANLDDEADELNPQERRQIIDAALRLLGEIYVHLPLKRAMHAVDPLQRLRILGQRDDKSCRAFHDEMLAIFHSLRDLHTGYVLPSYYQQRTAFLPFLVEEYFEDRGPGSPPERCYVVTKVCPGPCHGDFRPGVRITHWNGVPIGRAVELNAQREAGSNVDAQMARGLGALTIRPMGHTAPPDERWVIVGYETEDGRALESRFEWCVISPPPSPPGIEPTTIGLRAGLGHLHLGVDAQAEAVRSTKKALFGASPTDAGRTPAAPAAVSPPRGLQATSRLMPQATDSEHTDAAHPRDESGLDYQTDSVRRSKTKLFSREVHRTDEEKVIAPEAWPAVARPDLDQISTMPDVFLFRRVPGSLGEIGYVRIFTFMVEDADAFVAEFVRILSLLPGDGLILDVRGNSGGNILAGERLLQTLTPHPIEPLRFHFLNTPTTLELCEAKPMGLDLSRWSLSIRLAIETGETYSQGFPLGPVEETNRVGQRYYGPVVLIVDALCYSTTDIVAAGFQDHRIGKILGTAYHTGAGGANVWDYPLVQQALPGRFGPLPKGVTFRVALRRATRVGDRAGVPVEDLGVEPDRVHRMTRRDVMGQNEDLIATAAAMLVELPVRRLSARLESQRPPEVMVRVEARNIARVDFFVWDRPLGSAVVRGGEATWRLAEGLPNGQSLEIRGIDGGQVVAVSRLTPP